MQNATEKVWKIITCHYKNTGFSESRIDIPFEIREKRMEIAKELKYYGLINSYNWYGKDKLHYSLTQKAIQLINTEMR